MVQFKDKSSSSSTSDSNLFNTNEVLKDKGDVITIKEESIDSTDSTTRSDNNMMAKQIIEEDKMLNDKHINLVQRMIKQDHV